MNGVRGMAEHSTISIHAPAWGATAEKRQHIAVFYNFNPRSRVGSDDRKNELAAAKKISIHAPAWGATPNLRNIDVDTLISIHAPAWGATS